MEIEERRGLLYVAIAVVFFSMSPVLITWADPMPSLIKTTGRLIIATITIGALSRLVPSTAPTTTQTLKARTSKQSALRFAGYGLVTALHFLFYVSSLNFTTTAHALAIIYTAPVFAAIFSAILLKEPIKPRRWLGVILTVVGIAVLAGLEPAISQQMIFGDLLALLAAITYAFYSIAGRYERDRYPLFVYASRVYGIAALWLLPAAIFLVPTAPAGSWGLPQMAAILALGIGPHALGHTLFNASLRRVHATYVNVIASQEVTGGIILAFLFLGQIPSLNAIVGVAITLAGILIVLL